MREMSSPAEEMLASQEGMCSVESVIQTFCRVPRPLHFTHASHYSVFVSFHHLNKCIAKYRYLLPGCDTVCAINISKYTASFTAEAVTDFCPEVEDSMQCWQPVTGLYVWCYNPQNHSMDLPCHGSIMSHTTKAVAETCSISPCTRSLNQLFALLETAPVIWPG